MSRRNMTLAAMSAVSADLLTNAWKRALLERDPLTAAMIPRLEASYREILVLTADEGEVKAQIQAIGRDLAGRDGFNNRSGRAIYRALDTAEDLAASPDEAAAYGEVRDLLFPKGLSVNTLSYLEKAGNAIRVEGRTTAEVRAVLRTIRFGDQDLEQVFDAWLANARRMGELVARRAELSGQSDATRVSASDMRHARLRWMRLIRALIQNLELTEITATERRRLLAILREAESQAARPRPAKKRAPDEVESGEGEGEGEVEGEGDGEDGAPPAVPEAGVDERSEAGVGEGVGEGDSEGPPSGEVESEVAEPA